MDGIVYGVAASLGFATYENYYYVYSYAIELGISSEAVAYLRAFSAVPMHGLNGCVMGFYFGQFAFTGERKYLGFSLLMPFIFHGALQLFHWKHTCDWLLNNYSNVNILFFIA